MRLLAGLGGGAFVYLSLGLVLGASPSWLGSRKRVRRRGAGWQDWLQQAGGGVSVRQFATASGLAALSGGGLIFLVVRVGVLAFLAGSFAGLSPLAVLAQRRRKLMAERTGAWPDALRDLITHLRAGASVHAGLGQLATTGPLPLRPFFLRYRNLAGALDHRAALEVVREELADPLSDRIIEVLVVALEQGPSVVIDVLEDLATATVGDLRLVEEIETSQLETRLEARAAAVMPFVVLALLCSTSDDYRAFYQTSFGWFVVLFGAVLSAVGLGVISRLGRLPREERTLAGGST